MWEERGGMRLGPHAQLDQIKARYPICVKDPAHLLRVRQRGGITILGIGRGTMDMVGWDRQLAEQELVGQVIVALSIIWRHATFVTPEDLDLVPVDLAAIWLTRQNGIQLFR